MGIGASTGRHLLQRPDVVHDPEPAPYVEITRSLKCSCTVIHDTGAAGRFD